MKNEKLVSGIALLVAMLITTPLVLAEIRDSVQLTFVAITIFAVVYVTLLTYYSLPEGS